ncbi:MAG: NAD+ synthase (glutamine-hydrolyzing) [Paraglaciecola sp.]|jgi:NAD+ synthase (glutamine-hydrolysing)
MNYQQKMQDLCIAMVQMAIADDPMENARNFLSKVNEAVAEGADVVVGSEMMLSQYVSGDRYEDDTFVAEMIKASQLIVAESKSIDAVIIYGGIACDDFGIAAEDGRIRKYNAAFIAQAGELVWNANKSLMFAVKSLMPNYRIFDDSRHFYDLRKLAAERGVPLSDLQQPFPITIRGVVFSLGVMLCEDMWDSDYAQKPAQTLKQNGAEVLINLSCSNWSWRKNAKRDQVIANICQETGLWFVYVNNVGCQNNGKNFITFDGASTIYNPFGEAVVLAKNYQLETNVASLDSQRIVLTRHEPSDIAQMYRAIEVASKGFLGTLPQSAQQKVVIGVSGGMDSALSVAFFAHLMGANKVVGVNMPYKHYNAAETKNDAAQMCRRLNVEYRVVPIDTIVDATCKLADIEEGTSQHKTAQAVARMNVLSALASQASGFFTCNANWTEIAFGYGTLNGDMRGTFAPWMNLLKQDVYRLGDYLNREVYGREVIPQSVIDRPPMDELVEAESGVRSDPFDYGNLTENGYHDQMVRAVVAFRYGPEWFVEQYSNGSLEQKLQLPEGKLNILFPTSQVWLEDLERCFSLFQAAVFKRVQSVPGPLVDKRSFGWDLRESILDQVNTTHYKTLVQHLRLKSG